ncbi:substrate-binding periplasmic protein [Piscirickettsia litoralis]|uniref:Solute-binding protein family 3/N-terminal domain-containing protein n=1 Tax=Piscirickettsia litoralis TaxID=1891921 RepID=A0ABX3A4E6_9GAMM|nr:transporter substrate-binding domain-containing protein [Piscirickettsia litoralis]ODN42260.1 hypothetical protein BGC07_04050 [Piscirickettsia litoralis]
MKILSLFIFWLHLLLLSVPALAKETLTFAYQDSENFPYQLGNGQTIPTLLPGLAVDIVKLAAKRLNLTVKLVRMPWKRALVSLGANQVDGVFNASFKRVRERYGVYPMIEGHVDASKKSYANSYSFYGLKSSKLSFENKQLLPHSPKMKVVTIRGFSIAEDLKNMNVRVVEVSTVAEAFHLLKLGRVKVAAIFSLSGDFYLKKDQNIYRDIVKIEPPIKTKNYYLMLSKQFVRNHPKLATRIWQEIGKIRASGEINTLSEKYFSELK